MRLRGELTRLTGLIAIAFVIGSGAEYSFGRAATGTAVTVRDDDQKKGRGRGDRDRGNGRGRGEGKDERRGERGNRGDNNRKAWGDSGSPRQNHHSDRGSKRQHQQIFDWNSRRQQRLSDRNLRRQQQWSDWNARRQQQISDWNARRQQIESDRRSRRQQVVSDRNWGRDRWNGDRRRQRDDDNRDGRNFNRDERNFRVPRGQRPVYYQNQSRIFNNAWGNLAPWNYGLVRREQAHLLRDQRRYWKQVRKDQRRFDRDQQRLARQQNFLNQVYTQPGRAAYYNDSYSPDYYSGGGNDIQDVVLRTLIVNVLGGGGFDGGDYLPITRYARVVPNINGYDSPSYVYRQPYSNAVYNEPYYYDEPSYNSFGSSLGGGILGSLPIAEIIQEFTGDNEFVSQLVGSFLSQGYDQGYLAGQAARDYGYSDAEYNDPYTYSNGITDPYSASMGESRRYLSQGYDLGYRDALAGNTFYDPQTDGNVDLVGAILNSVLSGI